MKFEDEIDQLYQLPLKEFTAARNALAKRARGADAARVRTLPKPNAAAWGVNQLYWRERASYERLVEAAERVRTAHRSLLAGKAVDLHDVERAHRDAIRDATHKVRDILTSAGESDSAATMRAVGETLDALPPVEEPGGRLTRPLQRMGFAALAGVASRSPAGPPRGLSLVSSRDKKAPDKPAMSEARQREIDEIGTRLRTAEAEERQRRVEIERGRRELDRAEREQTRVQRELAETKATVKRLRAGLAEKEKAHRISEAEQHKLSERLAKITGP